MLSYKEVKLVWNADVEDLIEKTYDREFSFAAEYELGQNSIVTVGSVPTEKVHHTPSDEFTRWTAGEDPKYYYNLIEELFDDLYRRGHIGEGIYAVEIWW